MKEPLKVFKSNLLLSFTPCLTLPGKRSYFELLAFTPCSERREGNYSERVKRSPLQDYPDRKAVIQGTILQQRRQEQFLSRSGQTQSKS